jgi:hypothetical protein
MELNSDRKYLTNSIKRPFYFRFREQFSQRQMLKQSNFWKGLGSGIENAAALAFERDELKVSKTKSVGKFYLERPITKAREEAAECEKDPGYQSTLPQLPKYSAAIKHIFLKSVRR